MVWITPRTSVWKSTYALVVISPAITTRPVAVRVSQATRLVGSSARQASRIASEIWSAILSGCPSVTDSEVNKKRLRFDKTELLTKLANVAGRTPAEDGKAILGRVVRVPNQQVSDNAFASKRRTIRVEL